jgi:hypothetical protein
MNSEAPVSSTTETILTRYEEPFHRSLCWGAVLAGTMVAMGIHLLLTALGVGASLAIFRPMTDTVPAHFSTGMAIAWSFFAIVALSFGGWVAGRYSGCLRSGLLHGVLVWSLALIVALPWLVLGAGLGLGRAMKHHGDSLRASSQAAVVAGDEAAKAAARRNQVELGSFVTEAVQSIPTNTAPKAATRAEREVGFAVTKLFAPENAAAFPANRLETINTLMVYTEMTAADATITIDAWTTSEKNLQAELDKDSAEMNGLNLANQQAARADADALVIGKLEQISRGARWSFFALLFGLLGASLGGRCGAECAARSARNQREVGTAESFQIDAVPPLKSTPIKVHAFKT